MTKKIFRYSHNVSVNIVFNTNQKVEWFSPNETGIYPEESIKRNQNQILSFDARSIDLSLIPIEHLVLNSCGEFIPVFTIKDTCGILQLELIMNGIIAKTTVHREDINRITIDGINYWDSERHTFIDPENIPN